MRVVSLVKLLSAKPSYSNLNTMSSFKQGTGAQELKLTYTVESNSVMTWGLTFQMVGINSDTIRDLTARNPTKTGMT